MMLTGPQKAVVGFVISAVMAFLASILVSLQAIGDDAGFGDLTTTMWLTAVLATLGVAGSVFGGVYYTTNKLKVDIPDFSEE